MRPLHHCLAHLRPFRTTPPRLGQNGCLTRENLRGNQLKGLASAWVLWRTFTLPSILYFNTLLLLASSVTLEVSRRRVAAFMGGLKSQVESPARWLYVTLSLGLLFVACQYMAWMQLRSKGLYLATNPSSSFFYVLTAVHALHVLGGLGGLVRVIHKLSTSVLRRSTLDATARYWHFMGVLWLYLFLLLWTKV